MDPSLAIALCVFIISYALLASERINRTVVVALAFLVVVRSRSAATQKSADRNPESATLDAESSAFTRRRSPVRIRPSPSFFCQWDALETSNNAFSTARIMARNKQRA